MATVFFALGVFAAAYVFAILVFAQPISAIESGVVWASNGLTGFQHQLQHSNELGYLVLQQDASQQRVLYRFSSLDMVMFRTLAWVMAILAGVCFLLSLARWPFKRLVIMQSKQSEEPASKGVLLAYASQTGGARQLALQFQKAADALMDVHCVSTLNVAQMRQYQRVFFVVSTYGEGEPPDSAHRLVADLHRQSSTSPPPSSSSSTSFAVLALGDRTYRTFCAFGHSLTNLLEQVGFTREQAVHEVDRMDMASVSAWWQRIAHSIGLHNTTIHQDLSTFTVCENQHLNAPNHDRAAHYLRLHCDGVRYQAGDLIAVTPKVIPPTHERLYSIASCEEHYVDLLVRQHRREDGTLGTASSFLCKLAKGDTVEAQIRVHESFRLQGDRPLIMIGAGTGVAPFRGFLQQKQQWQSTSEHWLIFGEQYAEYDDYFHADFTRFQQDGLLTRIDKAWSRSEQRYVQAILIKESERLYKWVTQKGAQIYLCGSRVGFGEMVLEQLTVILGEDTLQHCLHSDLY
ncbi:flavodoxin domain-containing protein [Marinomonas sp. A79]|uniref:Flavodoxin domain-containing protein n=1 Tax=Marinomonas vulgaris TaxID=2823372 RepID=A0ABS5HE53_9GAMM|nr:flavodoxin domain-containing protein [Marinomonas vulgaris]MBR7889770.1 flavodoxin domain-containing protein [Marinomonas vulgaris]